MRLNRVTRGKVGGGEMSAKTKPNACSLLEKYQNLKIFNHLRAIFKITAKNY